MHTTGIELAHNNQPLALAVKATYTVKKYHVSETLIKSNKHHNNDIPKCTRMRKYWLNLLFVLQSNMSRFAFSDRLTVQG